MIQRLALETQQIIKYLETCYYADEIATCERLAELANTPKFNDKARYYVTKAREILHKEKGMVFATLTKVGLKKLTSDEVVTVRGAIRRKDAESAIARWEKDLQTVNPAELSPETASSYMTQVVQLQLVGGVTGAEGTRKIEQKVVAQKDPLAWAKGVDLLEAWG